MSVEDPHEAERKLRGESVPAPDHEDGADSEPLKGGLYRTGEISPTSLLLSGASRGVGWQIEDEDLSERFVEVFYSTVGVSVCFEGRDGDLRGGGSIDISTDEARELATAIYQAAEELDRRREVTDS